MRKAMLILGVVAAAAAAMPAAAPALVWTDEGLEVQGNKAVPLEGNLTFQSPGGGVNCESALKASITLEAGTTKGTVTEFAPNLSKCKTTGGLAQCTLTGIHPEGLPWSFTFDGTKFSIPGFKVTHTLHGVFCPNPFTLSGGAGGPTATPDPSRTEIKELTLGGQGTTSLGQNAAISGTLAPTSGGDVGTYGITVPAVWTDEGLEVQGNKAVPLEGNLNFIAPIGGVNCESGAKASITLEAGTTKGTVTELAPDLSKCKPHSGLALCTLTGIHPEGLPWSFTFDGTKFSISGYKISYTLHGTLCPTTLTLSGATHVPTATPDPGVAEIDELTLGGTARITQTNQTASLSGTLAPTSGGDAGTYGITVPE